MNDDKFINLWNDVIHYLKPFFDNENIYNDCVKTSKFYKYYNDTLIIIVKSTFAKSILINDYQDKISSFINEKLKTSIKIIFICDNEVNLFNYDNDLINQNNLDHKNNENNGLIADYTFDNFIVGEFNKNAYDGVTAISNKLGSLYNPLFIYGRTGIGKTHLIMALGNYYLNRYQDKKVKYIECDTFVNEVVTSIAKGSNYINNLKDYYSSFDLLLIDDIQFLSGKEKTNETFFQIFNRLVKNNKQIVLTSDKAPELLDSLEERMVSRFTSGLTLKINKPDIDSLKRIVSERTNQFNNIKFSQDAIEEIIKYYNNDLRKLIGFLNQINFYAIQNLKPNEIITKNIIDDFITNNTSVSINPEIVNVNPEMIISIVCKWYSLKEDLIKGKSRLKNLVMIRHICMYIMRKKLNLSYSDIGKYFSNRDHTTVMNGIEKISKQIEKDSMLKEYIEKIISKI